MYTTNGQNGAISIIRKMSVSVLFLVGAIGYSVYVLFGLVGSLAGGSEVTDLMDQIMAMSGGYSSLDYSAVRAVSGMFNGITVFSMLVSMLPAMVIVAGIWLIFAAAKRNMLPGTASAVQHGL